MNKCTERVYNGLIKENPTFVLMLGMCPTLAVTTSAINGLGMGLSTTVVLVLSNMLISMLRKVIPDSVRMPAFIVVVASFVTIVQFLLEGFVPSLYDSLGLYIPLIVVICIILGRAESYASKNPVLPSIFDANVSRIDKVIILPGGCNIALNLLCSPRIHQPALYNIVQRDKINQVYFCVRADFIHYMTYFKKMIGTNMK